MSERIIIIEPYKTYNDVIILNGKVHFPELEIDIDIPPSQSLNLYQHEYNESLLIIPRQYDSMIVKVGVGWKKDFQVSSFSNLLSDFENPTEVLALRIQVVSEKTRWCSEQKKIDLANINKRATFNFEIPLSEVKANLKVQGYVTRETEAKGLKIGTSEAPLAILSTCKELSIQIDEQRDIGGEYLPISAGNTGDLAFEITGIDNPFELPRIFYSEDLKDYLTRDDLLSVSSSILTGMLFFLDQYLKWFVFVCRVETNNKYHNSLVDLFSRYCLVPKDDIIDLVKLEKYSEEQVKLYLELSNKLYKGIQTQNKYKRELKNIYKNEAK